MINIDNILANETIEEMKPSAQVLDEIKDLCRSVLDSTKNILISSTILSLITLNISSDSLIIDNQTPTLPIISQTKVTLALAEISETKSKLNEVLNELRILKDGWDGQNALKPKKSAIDQAQYLVDSLDDKVLAKCYLFPSNDAGIFLQGKFPKGNLSVYLNGEVMTYVVKGNYEGRMSASVKQNANTANILNQGLLMYL